MISVIIPTYNRNEDLERCLSSIRENSRLNPEIIVLHPKTDPKTEELCVRYSARSENDGARVDGKRVRSLWGIINHGINIAANRYVCWLNDDCLVLPDWDAMSLKYFTDDTDLSLLVLKTKGIQQNPEFIISINETGIPVANYGILDRETGYRFDERFNWFYGDVDLPMQIARDGQKTIRGSSENMIIHNHVIDENRKANETNPAAIADEHMFDRKWWPYKAVDGRLVKKNPIEYLKLDRAAKKLSRILAGSAK